jgi:hypothetical protein
VTGARYGMVHAAPGDAGQANAAAGGGGKLLLHLLATLVGNSIICRLYFFFDKLYF